jgi:hypothetical protein
MRATSIQSDDSAAAVKVGEDVSEEKRSKWLGIFVPFSILFLGLLAFGTGLAVMTPAQDAPVCVGVPSTSGGYLSDLTRALPRIAAPVVAIKPTVSVKLTIPKTVTTSNGGGSTSTGSGSTDSDGDNDGSGSSTGSGNGDQDGQSGSEKSKGDDKAKTTGVKADGDGSGKAQGDNHESSKSKGK